MNIWQSQDMRYLRGRFVVDDSGREERLSALEHCCLRLETNSLLLVLHFVNFLSDSLTQVVRTIHYFLEGLLNPRQ